jgi:sulfur carrier protein
MVTVELVGDETREVSVADAATYAALLGPFDVSPHEVTITVDGTPVPEDARIDDSVDRVQVVRLIKGG